MRRRAQGFRRAGALALLLALGVLGACSGGEDESTTELEIIRAGRDILARRTAPAAPRPALTRAALDTVEGSFIEATLERRDQLAYLSLSMLRRDEQPGVIAVWRTEDNITLATRNGVLVATRGLGGDILSSAAPVAGDRPGPARGGERVYEIRALDNKVRRLPMVCELEDLGAVTIVIVERRHATRHLRETCTGGMTAQGTGEGRVVNDYWIDSARAMVVQSRQWAGPETGYLRLRRLTY